MTIKKTMLSEGYVPISVAAEIVGVNRTTIWRQHKDGELDGKKVGGFIYVRLIGERSIANLYPSRNVTERISREITGVVQEETRTKSCYGHTCDGINGNDDE